MRGKRTQSVVGLESIRTSTIAGSPKEKVKTEAAADESFSDFPRHNSLEFKEK